MRRRRHAAFRAGVGPEAMRKERRTALMAAEWGVRSWQIHRSGKSTSHLIRRFFRTAGRAGKYSARNRWRKDRIASGRELLDTLWSCNAKEQGMHVVPDSGWFVSWQVTPFALTTGNTRFFPYMRKKYLSTSMLTPPAFLPRTAGLLCLEAKRRPVRFRSCEPYEHSIRRSHQGRFPLKRPLESMSRRRFHPVHWYVSPSLKTGCSERGHLCFGGVSYRNRICDRGGQL